MIEDAVPSMFGTNSRGNSFYPLQSTADRVGREVERFAEKVDQWNNHRNGSSKERYEATVTLVDDLQKITDSAVARLRKQQQAAERHSASYSQQKSSQRQLGQFGHDRSFLDSIANGQDRASKSGTSHVSELRQWQMERDTWELFGLLLKQRQREPGTSIEKEKEAALAELGEVDRYTSESDMWQRFFIVDDEAKERDIICKWLERSAAHIDGPTDAMIAKLEQEAGIGSGIWSQGWLNTREKIKGQKRVGIFSQASKNSFVASSQEGKSDLITALDPDALTRQERVLDKRDQALEKSLWLALYAMLRRGADLDLIREWSRDRSEGWRAVSLGCTASPDAPNNVGLVNSAALWRRMCVAAARSGGANEFERAVYGLLGGDVEAVEVVCRGWDDLLYANFTSLNLNRYDLYVQNNFYFRLPGQLARRFTSYTGPLISPEESNGRIVHLLRNHDISKSEAEHPLKIIQASIIEKKFESLVYGLGIAISQIPHPTEPASKIIPRVDEPVDRRIAAMARDDDAVRMAVHMLLIQQVFGFDMGTGDLRTIYENVLVKYIGYLREQGKFDIIPMYASLLSKERCEITLGRILPFIGNGKERIDITRLMEQYKINAVAVFTEQQALAFSESALRAEEDNPRIPDLKMLEPVDDELRWPRYRMRNGFVKSTELAPGEDAIIRSLEWYLLLQGQWAVTFAAIAYTYKRFLRRFISFFRNLLNKPSHLLTYMPFPSFNEQ